MAGKYAYAWKIIENNSFYTPFTKIPLSFAANQGSSHPKQKTHPAAAQNDQWNWKKKGEKHRLFNTSNLSSYGTQFILPSYLSWTPKAEVWHQMKILGLLAHFRAWLDSVVLSRLQVIPVKQISIFKP